MAEIIKNNFHLIDNAKIAMSKAGVEPVIIPIRGGTDGARLSFEGLPCPNLSTGGYNFHGRKEFIPSFALEKMVEVMLNLIDIYSKS
jgi:tripeptide aminopeptidase